MQEEQLAIEPLESDTKEFIRSLLGERSFSKSYELYDAKLKVTFATLGTNKEKLLQSLCREIPNGSNRISRIVNLRLLFHIAKINDTIFAFKASELSELTVCELLYEKHILSIYSSDMIAILMRTLVFFQKLKERLIEKAFDVNFYKGAGLS